MKLRALSACVAVLVFAVACANTAQQPETQPAVVPTPSMELLDTRSYPVRHITVLLPGGIISDEVQSELWEYEATYLDGKPLPPPYNLKYNYGYSTSLGVHFIEIVQEIYLPKEAYVQSLIAYGPPPPLQSEWALLWEYEAYMAGLKLEKTKLIHSGSCSSSSDVIGLLSLNLKPMKNTGGQSGRNGSTIPLLPLCLLQSQQHWYLYLR